MTERQLEIIKKILYSSSPFSIKNLMQTFFVSERTIKYDISDIRKKLKEIDVKLLNKKGFGYYFLPETKAKLIEHFALSDPEDTLIKDQTNLLMYTLFQENPASLTSISEKLFFDVSTIKRYIEEITINQKHVELKLENDQIEIIGNEYEVRKFYTDLIINQIEKTTGSDLDIRIISAFPNYEKEINIDWMRRVKSMTRSQLKKDNIWISEDSFEYLILYLFVLYYRDTDKEEKKIKLKDLKVSIKEEYFFAEELLKSIFWGKFSEHEIYYLVKIMFENDIFSEGKLDNEIEVKLSYVIDHMIEHILKNNSTFMINEEKLKKDLRPHLKQIIRKHELGVDFEKNPLFYQIKQKYDEHFQYAKEVYSIFCNFFDIPYSDDEASLIAIYLYKNTINSDKKVYKAYLVCGSGRGFSKLLEQRLSNIFPNIVVLESLSSFYLLKKQNISEVDLIISTIDLPELSVPVVKVTSFLGRRDVQLIDQILEYGMNTQSLSFSADDQETSYILSEEINNNSLNREQTKIFTNIFLRFYNMLVNLPEEYQINQDRLLGITIHLIIALPRYFDSENVIEDQSLVDEVVKIEVEHKTLAREMNLFLNKIETELGVGIPYSERYALYQYILN